MVLRNAHHCPAIRAAFGGINTVEAGIPSTVLYDPIFHSPWPDPLPGGFSFSRLSVC